MIYEVWQMPMEKAKDYMFPWNDSMPSRDYYEKVYTGELKVYSDKEKRHEIALDTDELLEVLFHKLNVDHPKDYHTRSLSISDVICLHDKDKEKTWWYVNDVGFKKLDWE